MKIKQTLIILFTLLFFCGSVFAAGSKFGRSATSEIIVQSDQTIQSVIDSCSGAVGNLKDGFTNPYIINVPPGHETEYYSLVRNASDDASDKRNVKVIFEDNPDGKFIIEDFDDLSSGCISHDGTVEYVASKYCLSDKACVHCYKTAGDSGTSLFFFTLPGNVNKHRNSSS